MHKALYHASTSVGSILPHSCHTSTSPSATPQAALAPQAVLRQPQLFVLRFNNGNAVCVWGRKEAKGGEKCMCIYELLFAVRTVLRPSVTNLSVALIFWFGVVACSLWLTAYGLLQTLFSSHWQRRAGGSHEHGHRRFQPRVRHKGVLPPRSHWGPVSVRTSPGPGIGSLTT
jgi:hypothetical protein